MEDMSTLMSTVHDSQYSGSEFTESLEETYAMDPLESLFDRSDDFDENPVKTEQNEFKVGHSHYDKVKLFRVIF